MMSKPVIRTLSQNVKDPAYCQYWWNIYAFDVYYAMKNNDELKYEEAVENLNKFETHIRKEHPTLLRRLRRPVERS